MTPKLQHAKYVLCAFALCAAAYAQQPAPPASSSAATQPASEREQIAERRAAATSELAAAKAALETATQDGRVAPESLPREIAILTRLDLTLGQILAALEHASELAASKAQIQSDLETLRARGPTEPQPYPFALLESLRDQLTSETSRSESRVDAAQVAQAALSSAKAAHEERERARRQAKEALETNADESRAPALSAALRLAQLESSAAGEEVRLREVELANQKLESEEHELRLAFLREKSDYVAREARFSRQGLDDFLAQIDEQEYRVNQALDWAKVDLSARDAQWIEARRKLDTSPAKTPELVEEAEARRLARQVRQREATLLGQQLQALAESRKAWNRRYETFNQLVQPTAMVEWQAETRQVQEQLARDIRLHSTRLAELRKDAITLDAKLASTQEAAPEALRWLEEQKRQLANLTRIYAETVDRLEAARRLHEKLLDELGREAQTVTWGERLSAAWGVVKSVWNYEITSVQDSPITVRKVVIGLVLLILGTYLARVLANQLVRRFLPRFGLSEGAAAAVQSLLFYLLVVTVAMLSLRVVNVPLTAFTILGGALAIGIGFGSQNVVNNFISGLILLAERPIRVGDLIQTEDLIGTVEHIGPRSTRVRGPENMDIIVPNSSFLERNVVNWTLSDDRYRTHITVGVVYGSPTREVTKLIRKALEEHGKVLSKPEPIVLFADFGDSALIFEAHFWIRMRRVMDRRITESDIRYRVDSLFREAGIVIAFPQRDVHLDSQAPIQVQLLQSGRTTEPLEAFDPLPKSAEPGDTGP